MTEYGLTRKMLAVLGSMIQRSMQMHMKHSWWKSDQPNIENFNWSIKNESSNY